MIGRKRTSRRLAQRIYSSESRVFRYIGAQSWVTRKGVLICITITLFCLSAAQVVSQYKSLLFTHRWRRLRRRWRQWSINSKHTIHAVPRGGTVPGAVAVQRDPPRTPHPFTVRVCLILYSATWAFLVACYVQKKITILLLNSL